MADVDMTDVPPPKAKSSKAGASGDVADGKKRFEVKKVMRLQLLNRSHQFIVLTPSQWNAVALWAWDIVVDNCAICRNHIMDLCKTC